MNSERVVLDSAAVLAFLCRERGGDDVIPYLTCGVMSAVNYSEVLTKLMDRGSPLEEAISFVSPFSLDIVPFGDELAAVTASLRPVTRSIGMSFADRACVALALQLRLPVITADKAWSQLNLNVNIKQLR